MKRVFRILFGLILLTMAAIAGYFFLDTGGEKRDIYSFVPEDFVFAVSSDRPIKDWQELSDSDIWQYLKGSSYFADITSDADYLDSLLANNKAIVNLVKLGELVISAQMYSSQDYDLVYLVDLKAGKLAKFKEPMNLLFKNLDYEVTMDKFFQIDIFQLRDPATGDVLYLSIVDNILVASYRKDLLREALEQSEKPSVREQVHFAEIKERIDPGELYTLFLNFNRLNRFMSAYTTEQPTLLADLGEVVSFAGMDLSTRDQLFKMEGYLRQIDTVPSYLSVFKDVGRGKIRAFEVLPASTSMFTSISFDDFTKFYRKFEEYYQSQKPEEYAELNKDKERIEKFLKINFEEDFFQWMSEEVATAVIPTNEQKTSFAYYALLHFRDYDLAKERLDHLIEQVRKRTPVRFTGEDYRGFEIKYLELKGFFKLFFKKLFSRIENPHFTYIDDYVVFSNDVPSLQLLIDDYLDQQTLQRDEGFQDFYDRFDRRSNIFTYMKNENFYPYLNSLLDPATRKDLAVNRDYLLSFPHIGLQVFPASGMYKVSMVGAFKQP